MTNMRNWLDLYKSYESSLYENFQSNISGEFEESGWVYISGFEWVEMEEHEGLIDIQFAGIQYNKEWIEAENNLDSRVRKYGGITVPPFIDEDQLWVAIARFLEAEGYKDIAAQFDVSSGSWYGNGIYINVSNSIVAQGKALKMKKRFKKRK